MYLTNISACMTIPRPQERPFQGVMKFTILVVPSMVNITVNSLCLIYAKEQRRNISILHSSSQKVGLGWGEGHGIYNFKPPNPTGATYQIWKRCSS